MASAPSYASTAVTWCALAPGTADTSFTSPSNVNQLGGAAGTAGPSGAKISQIDVIPVAGTTVAGVLNIFLYDGSAYHMQEQVQISAGTVNTTTAGAKVSYYYDNLVLEPNWALRVTTTVSGNVSLHEINAFGADF